MSTLATGAKTCGCRDNFFCRSHIMERNNCLCRHEKCLLSSLTLVCRRLSTKMRGQYAGYHMSGLGQGEASLESLGQGEFSQSALSSELSSTVIETDNPFTESSGSPLQHYQDFNGSPLRFTGHPNQNTAFSDEPKSMSMPAEGWKLPRCLSRSSSQVAAESSPLRWCGSSQHAPSNVCKPSMMVARRSSTSMSSLFRSGMLLRSSSERNFETVVSNQTAAAWRMRACAGLLS